MSTPDAVVDPQTPLEPASPSAREAAILLARSGAPLTAKQFMAILGVAVGTFYTNDKAGKYDAFKMATVGTFRYSGTVITKWLNGEPIYVPRRRRKL